MYLFRAGDKGRSVKDLSRLFRLTSRMVGRVYRAFYLWVIERVGLLKFCGGVLIGRAIGPKYYQASNGRYERCGERAKQAYPPRILSYRS